MKHDPVEHPKHYTHSGIECIDVIEALGCGYHIGNAIKYLWRAGHKDDIIQDLRKAAWFIHRKVDQLERDGDDGTTPPTPLDDAQE